jgi:hypothetical protein
MAESKEEVLEKTKWLINQLQLHSFTKLECIAPMGQPTVVPDPSHSGETNTRESLHNTPSALLEIGTMVSTTD